MDAEGDSVRQLISPGMAVHVVAGGQDFMLRGEQAEQIASSVSQGNSPAPGIDMVTVYPNGVGGQALSYVVTPFGAELTNGR